MPDTQLTNPAAQDNEVWGTAQTIEEYVYWSTAATPPNLQNGQIVQVVGGGSYSGGIFTPSGSPGSVTSALLPYIAPITNTSVGFKAIGVVTNAPTGGYTNGSVVQVVTKGMAAVLVQGTSSAIGNVVTDTTISTLPGVGSISATVVAAGSNLGVCYTVATLSTTAGTLIYAYINQF